MNQPRLIGPGGQPLGRPPVVAHILSFPPGATMESIQATIDYWQRTLGVPAVVLADGIVLAGQLLADGTVEIVQVDPVTTALVQQVLVERGDLRDQIDAQAAAGGNGATGG